MHTGAIIAQDRFPSVEVARFFVRRVATHSATRVTLRQGIMGLVA
jgi:hypothetical protein